MSNFTNIKLAPAFSKFLSYCGTTYVCTGFKLSYFVHTTSNNLTSVIAVLFKLFKYQRVLLAFNTGIERKQGN